ncbi:MAG TPA: primosomal protein N' [Burkholderiaceae bacterium]|nr:primosomal protein N' [Burkholderiaceae bacterium]
MTTPSYWQVLLDLPFAASLDYLAPAPPVAAPVGLRCVVPLGRRKLVGIVTGVRDKSDVDPARLRPVTQLLDEVPALGAHWLALTRFAADYYQHAWGEVALPALPPALRQVPGPRYAQVMTRLRAAPPAGPRLESALAPTLTAEQAVVVREVLRACGFAPFLLFGATGTGKTEVYLSAIERALAAHAGSQALLLVPEINLTPQLEAQVRARFPDQGVVAMHSGLAAGERAAAWLAAHEGRARVVVGTRLAVFASLPQLALIVVDEEHDSSYKAGEGVRYSARDLAVKRAQMLGVPVILGSATPSLETWSQARAGRYRLLELKQRPTPDDRIEPVIELVDPGRERSDSGVAPAIERALSECLQRGEQSLVFLNRRGYAPVVACDACGWMSSCPHCTAFAVFHKTDRTLRCHHCGWSAPVPRSCPTCGNSALHGVGRGTQRIEESLGELLPTARVLRIDRDATRRRDSAAAALGAVHRGDVDVLVGTQMVAKGHDFRNIALVVVLNADSQLASQDFRASERLFATLVQVIGRAGRSGRPSRALVQTRYPAHPLFAALTRQDYAAFADALLAERRRAGMPPDSHQALLTAEARHIDQALTFLRQAVELADAPAGVRIYDPVPMALARRAGVERAQLLVEASERGPLHAFLRRWLGELRAGKTRVRWQIEVDPAQI